MIRNESDWELPHCAEEERHSKAATAVSVKSKYFSSPLAAFQFSSSVVYRCCSPALTLESTWTLINESLSICHELECDERVSAVQRVNSLRFMCRSAVADCHSRAASHSIHTRHNRVWGIRQLFVSSSERHRFGSLVGQICRMSSSNVYDDEICTMLHSAASLSWSVDSQQSVDMRYQWFDCRLSDSAENDQVHQLRTEWRMQPMSSLNPTLFISTHHSDTHTPLHCTRLYSSHAMIEPRTKEDPNHAACKACKEDEWMAVFCCNRLVHESAWFS